ncbi:Uncharacterised protein [Citrobacter braakii]|nr:Uncharacterised protein [Citrobacter braakii]
MCPQAGSGIFYVLTNPFIGRFPEKSNEKLDVMKLAWSGYVQQQ